ncbi:hypothetical protein EUX98_g7345 [Antrodiella citrinella]|uniref:Uncharacterized protein n=1 Tax=Antrodiella citrinella TaxID=2447956 RepID=A0A4S4MNP2_9APHY|nr:hypothetical protein EUX98_g7345 [Antrodiella citrinella]
MPPYNFPQGPVNETNAQIFADIMDINAADISFVAYGVLATLYFLCLTLLWEERHKKPKATWVWITYITVVFIYGTIGNGVNMFLNQDAFVDHRSYPGGPGQFEIEQYALTYNAVGTVVVTSGTWFTDGLMIYRFYTILGATWWIMVVPVALYVTSIVMSILLMHQLVSPGGTFWVPESINFALVYWSTSIAINVILTLGIVGFLLYMRLRVRHALGKHYNSMYITISTMLIESVFLYTAFALAFLVPLARNNEVNLLFLQVLPQIQFIAPLLIILRVAQGRALTRKSVDETLQSVSNSAGGSLRFGGLGSNTTYTSTTLNLDKEPVQQPGQSVEMLAFRPMGKEQETAANDGVQGVVTVRLGEMGVPQRGDSEE